MRTICLSLLFILCLSSVSFAQQKRIAFEGAVQAGLLEGEKGSAVQFGAMAGIKKNTWTASVGSGLDYYGIRSIPLYANLQKNIFGNPICNAAWEKAFRIGEKLYKTGRVQDQAEGEIIHQAAAFSSKVYDAISARIDF